MKKKLDEEIIRLLLPGEAADNLISGIIQKSPDIIEVFDTKPTDKELSHFIDSGSKCSTLQIRETNESMAVKPRGLPLLFATICLLMPCSIIVFAALTGRLGGVETIFEKARVVVMASLAGIALFSILMLINRSQKAKGDFFFFDKNTKELRLCRFDVVLSPEQIQELFSLNGGSKNGWLCELTVITKAETGEFVRYPVITTNYARQVEKVGEKLAVLLDVPLRKIKLKKEIENINC